MFHAVDGRNPEPPKKHGFKVARNGFRLSTVRFHFIHHCRNSPISVNHVPLPCASPNSSTFGRTVRRHKLKQNNLQSSRNSCLVCGIILSSMSKVKQYCNAMPQAIENTTSLPQTCSDGMFTVRGHPTHHCQMMHRYKRPAHAASYAPTSHPFRKHTTSKCPQIRGKLAYSILKSSSSGVARGAPLQW